MSLSALAPQGPEETISQRATACVICGTVGPLNEDGECLPEDEETKIERPRKDVK